MQKFFTNTLENKFIKNLLRNSPIPLYSTVAVGDYITKGCTYIFRYNVIRCTASGYITETYTNTSGMFDILHPFKFGEYDPKISEKFISKYNYYDSETHRYLGDYLRCIRDIYNIDLMPFYNCFNYKVVSNIDLKTPYPYVSDTYDKVLLVPIKFNKTYTIALDCASEVRIKGIIYDNFGMFNRSNTAIPDYLTQYLEDSLHVYQGISFKQPITYRISTESENDILISQEDGQSYISADDLYAFQKYLYIAIQIPQNVISSVVVLEGDYTQYRNVVINAEVLPSMSQQELNALCLSNLALLEFNDYTIYAFSNRLIEYLLLNVVTSQETLTDNIVRVQEEVGLPIPYRDAGIWSNELRYYIFTKYMNTAVSTKRVPVVDINGFVDVDIEKALMRGELK